MVHEDYLHTYRYLEDETLERDPLWEKSFETIRKTIEGPTEIDRGSIIPLTNKRDDYSVDYNKCWTSEHVKDETIWIPGYKLQEECIAGYKGKTIKATGKRQLKTVSYKLADTAAELKGKAIISCCPDPYCINPAHLFIVSNRYKFYDFLVGQLTEAEWKDIRTTINIMLNERQQIADIISTILDLPEDYVTKNKRIDAIKKDNPHWDITNDQILTRAIQRCTNRNIKELENMSLMECLENYQLLTAFRSSPQGFQKLMYDIVERTPQCDKYINKKEFYLQQMLLLAKRFDLMEVIIAINKILME